MEYTVGEGRLSYSNEYVVYVHDGYHHPFYKRIKLDQKWWQLKSPRQKIQEAREKANRICEQLQHKEMYINHEIEIAGGED